MKAMDGSGKFANTSQGRSQKKIMTEAMSMKNMTGAIGPFFS